MGIIGEVPDGASTASVAYVEVWLSEEVAGFACAAISALAFAAYIFSGVIYCDAY